MVGDLNRSHVSTYIDYMKILLLNPIAISGAMSHNIRHSAVKISDTMSYNLGHSVVIISETMSYNLSHSAAIISITGTDMVTITVSATTSFLVIISF